MARRARKNERRERAAATAVETVEAQPASAARASTPPAGATPAAARSPVAERAADARNAGRGRALSNAFIAAFLLFQVAMPLRYYLGDRGYDERFSWRMFSSLRMQRCKVRVRDELDDGAARRTRDVPLTRVLHVAWIGMLERYRPQVVEKVLARRCAEDGVRTARYVRECKDTDGSRLPALEVALDCASRAFTRSGEERAP